MRNIKPNMPLWQVFTEEVPNMNPIEEQLLATVEAECTNCIKLVSTIRSANADRKKAEELRSTMRRADCAATEFERRVMWTESNKK